MTKSDLEYLKTIVPIKDYLRDTPKSEKSIKTYLMALDWIFPSLIDRFKNEINYDINLDDYNKLGVKDRNKIKQDWYNEIANQVFEEWKKLSSNKKADILMKWANNRAENSNGKNRNTQLNYAWRIQGILSKLGREYEANPKNMERLSSNGFHLEEDITYEEVVELYEKLTNPKHKLILKIMMYTGLNPIDIINFRPRDFKRYVMDADNNYNKWISYVLIKIREKSKHKKVEFLITFEEEFIDEIRDYFERKIVKHIKKPNDNMSDKKYQKTKSKIKRYMEDTRFSRVEKDNYIIFTGEYDWIKDKNQNIFGDMTSKNVSDVMAYHVGINKLNSKLTPMIIRRLCFTNLKKIFSLTDGDIYQLWTQHKVGILTKNYTIDILKRTQPYFIDKKIQDSVLIGNIQALIKKIKNIETNGIKKINDLEKENNQMAQRINSLESKFRILEEAINKGLLIDTFPDGVESGSPNDEPIADKYVEMPSKSGEEIAKVIIDKALDKK